MSYFLSVSKEKQQVVLRRNFNSSTSLTQVSI